MVKTVSKHGNAVEELIDLKSGAWSRLGSTIFELRRRAEQITCENGKDADSHIKATERSLADAKNQLAAYRDYSTQLEKLVG